MEGPTMRLLKNRMLRRIFRHKREEVIQGRRKSHNEELHDLYIH
jgi:hypothetical protein